MVMATTAMCPKGTIGCDTETKDGTTSITCCCNSNLCNGVSTLRQQSSIVCIIMGTFAIITYQWF
jgi:hypothetical protein